MAIISITWLSIGRSLAIVSMMSISITTITMSISMAITISWLSIGRSLAITISMVSISTIAMSISMSITMAIISISWFSISRSLAIVSMVSITTISIAMAISMSITIAISWLGNNHSEEGDSKSSQKLHVICSSFSSELMPH